MMTVIFPTMLPLNDYQEMFRDNQKRGERLKRVAHSRMPRKIRWETIRTVEYIRRRRLRHLAANDNKPDAFIFHGYSYGQESYHLLIEVFDEHTSVFKTSLPIAPGENLFVLNREQLAPACWKANYLVKIYPENDLAAELDILWCDFVKGTPTVSDKPAPTVKCVVWDLDNTLWDGTLIESDPEKLSLRPGVAELIKALDERGIIQSVASKNDYKAAWPVVERLGLAEYFLYPQIHWHAKSGSIQQIARLLNIGVDTFALLDDSVFEREQVRSALPQVRVYDVTDLPGLTKLPEFSVMVTEESRMRRQMYQAEAKRNEILSLGNDDTIAFLKKCHLQIRLFEPKTEQELRRCYELLVRTNQLNMSGKKYTEEEFASVLHRDERKSFAFSCRDDFGEYGIVGFGQYGVENKELSFSEFAMSCRVAGKYVESALFAALLQQEGCATGRFDIQITKKNVLLRNTLKEIGFRETFADSGHICYQFDEKLLHRDLVEITEE